MFPVPVRWYGCDDCLFGIKLRIESVIGLDNESETINEKRRKSVAVVVFESENQLLEESVVLESDDNPLIGHFVAIIEMYQKIRRKTM